MAEDHCCIFNKQSLKDDLGPLLSADYESNLLVGTVKGTGG
jgi:hypothetical protein